MYICWKFCLYNSTHWKPLVVLWCSLVAPQLLLRPATPRPSSITSACYHGNVWLSHGD